MEFRAAYAGEMAWRENNRRISDGEQYLAVVNVVLLPAPAAQ